jgi:hypothetical protein
MDNKNHKLFKRHQHEIFDMICRVIDDAPLNPDVFGTATAEEKEEYNKKLNEYLDNKKSECVEKLIKMGFNFNE